MGKRYGRLVVVEYAGRDKHGNDRWFCRCVCGGCKTALGNNLRRGLTKSCGCLAREISAKLASKISKEYAWKRRKKNKIVLMGRVAHIHLPDGSIARISAKDVSKVKDIRWGGLCGGGEYVRSSNRVYLHRFILGVHKDRSVLVDHKDGNPLNNVRSNLRVATPSKNMQNARRRVGKCGYIGVSKTKYGRFGARINVNCRQVYLGTYSTAKEAAMSYNEAALIYYGKNARINEIRENL